MSPKTLLKPVILNVELLKLEALSSYDQPSQLSPHQSHHTVIPTQQ